MEADVVEVLHTKVDEMEELLDMAEDAAAAEATAQAEMDAQAHAQPEEETQEVEASVDTGVKTAEEEAEAEADTPVEAGPQAEAAGSDSQGTTKAASRASSALTPVASLPSPAQREQDMLGLALESPPEWLASSFKLTELSLSPPQSHPELTAATNQALEAAKQAAQAQAEMAERVAAEAEKLNVELAKVVRSLQARKEESDVSGYPTFLSHPSFFFFKSLTARFSTCTAS